MPSQVTIVLMLIPKARSCFGRLPEIPKGLSTHNHSRSSTGYLYVLLHAFANKSFVVRCAGNITIYCSCYMPIASI